MVGYTLAHLARHGLVRAVHRRGLASLESYAVYFGVSGLAQLVESGVVYYHCFGLQFSYRAVQPVLLPVGGGLVPHAVEPQSAYLAVMRAKRFHALNEIVYVRGKIVFVIFVVPIE